MSLVPNWAKTDSNPFIFYSSLCGLRGAGAYPTSEGEGGVHPGEAASLLQGQHRVTNKHPHSHTHTYWQFRAANQPKTHVLGTVGGRRKTWRETTAAHQKRALFGIKYAKKNKSKCFALTGRFKTGSDITHYVVLLLLVHRHVWACKLSPLLAPLTPQKLRQ